MNIENILKDLKIEKTVSGGSVANSIVGISQLCLLYTSDAADE